MEGNIKLKEIAIVGLGKAGLPLACVIAESGFDVKGVDINHRLCKMINKGLNPIIDEPDLDNFIKKYGGNQLKATTSYKEINDCSFYIVVVPVQLKNKYELDFTMLECVVKKIGALLKKDDCVVIETTVPPYTTEKLVRRWLEEKSKLKLGDFYLAYSPERIMTGVSIHRLKSYPKIIGGVNIVSSRKAFDVYKNFIPNLFLVSSSRVAEYIKIIEGCYRFVNISLANELYKIADELNIDFSEARKFANGIFCDIHYPSVGAGGHCIPVYPWFLVQKMMEHGRLDYSFLIESAYQVNKSMPFFWVDKIISESLNLNKPINQIKICVLGISFRDNVKSIINSKNLELVKLLLEKGFIVTVFDKFYSKNEIEGLGLVYGTPEDVDIVFNPFDTNEKIQVKR